MLILKVSKDIGLNLEAKYENMPIKLMGGSDQITELEIEYK